MEEKVQKPGWHASLRWSITHHSLLFIKQADVMVREWIFSQHHLDQHIGLFFSFAILYLF